jgi:hypothetical protein
MIESKAAKTMRYELIAIAVLALASQPAAAQIDRYDPTTGKYVTSDPFAQPHPSGPSPYRLNPRVARNMSAQPAPGTPQAPSAPGAPQAPQAPGASASLPAAPDPAPSQQLVPMSGMAMYGDDAGSADPFAKPDWWPH